MINTTHNLLYLQVNNDRIVNNCIKILTFYVTLYLENLQHKEYHVYEGLKPLFFVHQCDNCQNQTHYEELHLDHLQDKPDKTAKID